MKLNSVININSTNGIKLLKWSYKVNLCKTPSIQSNYQNENDSRIEVTERTAEQPKESLGEREQTRVDDKAAAVCFMLSR